MFTFDITGLYQSFCPVTQLGSPNSQEPRNDSAVKLSCQIYGILSDQEHRGSLLETLCLSYQLHLVLSLEYMRRILNHKIIFNLLKTHPQFNQKDVLFSKQHFVSA